MDQVERRCDSVNGIAGRGLRVYSKEDSELIRVSYTVGGYRIAHTAVAGATFITIPFGGK